MKGYAGREAPPKERLTVGPGQTALTTAIEQLKIAQAFADLRNPKLEAPIKFLRVDPHRYGVNFVTYTDAGQITSLAQVDAVPVALSDLQANDMPVIYPADPFLSVPTTLLVTYPVVFIAKFTDVLAYRLVFNKNAGAPVRVGQTSGQDVPSVVLTMDSKQFKIVEAE